jgi:hypothetical protein
MAWLLSSIVGSSKPTFAFNVGDAHAEAWGSWTHCRGTTKVCAPEADVGVGRAERTVCACARTSPRAALLQGG